jgi:hypothetical protein
MGQFLARSAFKARFDLTAGTAGDADRTRFLALWRRLSAPSLDLIFP